MTKKLGFKKSRVKTMLILFFDHQGVIYKEFVPQSTIVTSTFYKGVLERLLKRIARVHLEKFKDRDFFVLQNNAPTHNAAINQQFLAYKRVSKYLFYSLGFIFMLIITILHQKIFVFPIIHV